MYNQYLGLYSHKNKLTDFVIAVTDWNKCNMLDYVDGKHTKNT